MKVTLYFIFVLLFSLSSYAQSINTRCQSTTICLTKGMPIYSQSDYLLARYISSKIGKSIGWDPGWCGLTSAAMLLMGARSERTINSVSISPTYLDSGNYLDIQYQTGLAVKTDLINGGTYTNDARIGTAKVLRLLSSPPKPYYFMTITEFITNSPYSSNYSTSAALISEFRSSKPAIAFMVQNSFGRHLVTLNGYEGNYLKIFDPWGRIYSVSQRGLFSLTGSFLDFIPGTDSGIASNGFIPWAQYQGARTQLVETIQHIDSNPKMQLQSSIR